MNPAREHIWNVHVDTSSLREILDDIDGGVAAGVKGKTVFCANPHSLVVARDDPSFLNALLGADILIPDGAGIVVASRLLGGTIRRRITGSDVLNALAERWNTIPKRSFFFLGSTPEVLARIAARMSESFPRITICGAYAPTFSDEFSDDESEKMIDLVNRAAPTALWVGMTAPKQEKWISRNSHRLNVPLICAVGAAFDYFAGTKKRAGVVLQAKGLEWMPRLLREPRRMWRRNFISTPVFLLNVLRQRALSSGDLPVRKIMKGS